MPDILTRTDFDRLVSDRVEDEVEEQDYSGWYCVRTDSFPCPAEGCDFVAFFLTAAHLSIPYDAWVQVGRPVHGKLAKPEGWDGPTERRRL